MIRIMAFMLALVAPGNDGALAGEAEALANKLVEKGVITREEAAEVGEFAPSVPPWTKKLTFSGSLRLRHQWELKSGNPHRNRERIQYLLGAEAAVTDGVTAALGVSSGSDNHRSMNQTLDDTFSKKGLNLNYAYGRFEPAGSVVVYGGKFPNRKALWAPKDLIWDKDISFEGGGALIARGPVSLRGGAVVLDEYGKYDPAGGDPFNPRRDSWLYYAQPGVHFGLFSNRIEVRLAGTVYAFDAVKHHAPDRPDGSSVTNTTERWSVTRTGTVYSFDVLKYDYDSIGTGAEIALNWIHPLRIVFFGEAIHNIDKSVHGQDQGFLVGGTIGTGKVRKPGQWQVLYGYRELEPDAWPDLFSDSDFHGGATGVYGHEAEMTLAIANNTTFGLDYCYSRAQGHAGNDWKQVLQADLRLAF